MSFLAQTSTIKRTTGALALGLVCLQVADSAMTMWATAHGYIEVNAIVAPIVHTWWLPLSKVLPAMLVGVGIVWAVGRVPAPPKAIVAGLSSASAFLVAVIAGNVMELM